MVVELCTKPSTWPQEGARPPFGATKLNCAEFVEDYNMDIWFLRRAHDALATRYRAVVPFRRRAPKHKGVEMWLGMSVDEAMRQKDSRHEWVTHKYPLVEREFSRAQLLRWFEERYPGRVLPRSACVGCPFHSDSSWKDMQQNDPESFSEAVHIDWVLRNSPRTRGAVDGEAYLHASRVPLDQVDFSKATGYADLMAEECEGLCGI